MKLNTEKFKTPSYFAILSAWIVILVCTCGRTAEARPHGGPGGPGGPPPAHGRDFDRGPGPRHRDRGPSRGRQNAELIIGTTLGVLDIASRVIAPPTQTVVYQQTPAVTYTYAQPEVSVKTIYMTTSPSGNTYYSYPPNVPHVLVQQSFDKFKEWNSYGYINLDGQWNKVQLPSPTWR